MRIKWLYKSCLWLYFRTLTIYRVYMCRWWTCFRWGDYRRVCVAAPRCMSPVHSVPDSTLMLTETQKLTTLLMHSLRIYFWKLLVLCFAYLLQFEVGFPSWSDVVCNCVFLYVFLWHLSRSSLLVWTHLYNLPQVGSQLTSQWGKL